MGNYSKGELKLAFWRRFQAAWAARGIEMPMDEIMATMKDYYARGEDKKMRELVQRAKDENRPLIEIMNEASARGEWPLT